MHCNYEDIRDLIDEDPKWFDEHAVPRYCEFHPTKTANIYAHKAVLYEIECQECNFRFKVCESSDPYRNILNRFRETLIERAQSNQLNYGDPPNVNCCCVGPTMTSDFIRVLEIWKREDFTWRKIK